jgi:hypothetical protein
MEKPNFISVVTELSLLSPIRFHDVKLRHRGNLPLPFNATDSFATLTREDGTDTLSRNIGK